MQTNIFFVVGRGRANNFDRLEACMLNARQLGTKLIGK